jgi:hypothetical protein
VKAEERVRKERENTNVNTVDVDDVISGEDQSGRGIQKE